MNKLVVGCGYLGRRVAALWRANGDRVWATTRKAARADEFRSQGIEPIVCDILRPESLQSLPRVDAVCHAVGFDRTSGATMREVYVQGLRNFLQALTWPVRLIHVGSCSVYGQADGGWVDETLPTYPEEESGRIVLEAEDLLRAERSEAIILRFAGIYGPGRLLRQKAIEEGQPIAADPERWLNLIHVEDGARAALAAEGAPAGMTCNVADGNPVRRREFYAELARRLVAPEPRFVALGENHPTPPHEKANRRIDNHLLRRVLSFEFLYPDFRSGLAASHFPSM